MYMHTCRMCMYTLYIPTCAISNSCNFIQCNLQKARRSSHKPNELKYRPHEDRYVTRSAGGHSHDLPTTIDDKCRDATMQPSVDDWRFRRVVCPDCRGHHLRRFLLPRLSPRPSPFRLPLRSHHCLDHDPRWPQSIWFQAFLTPCSMKALVFLM